MSIAAIPLKWVGPISIIGPVLCEKISVPLATFETPLWPSVNRGAKVSMASSGITVTIVDERMTRSILFEAKSAGRCLQIIEELKTQFSDMQYLVGQTSRYAKLIGMNHQIVGPLMYLRFEFSTGDASGHNMSTKASDYLMQWISNKYLDLAQVSISGNYCADKKVSAVNGILGRGKYVVAEIFLNNAICKKLLRTDSKSIVDVNIKKNLIGSIVAGSLRSANAHFANMLLATYLATGQDAANIVEGSQGITYAEENDGNLYFSVTLPNLIVGTVGNGKDIEFVQENLKKLGCLEPRKPGHNARRLACIIAATVLCGELSLLAAITQPGELIRTHMCFEREKTTIRGNYND